MPIAPETRPGAVRLRVADLDRARGYYEGAIGLREVGETGEPESPDPEGGELVRLGADGTSVIELLGRRGARPRPPGTTGLFHLAILLPDRTELALALRRAVEANAVIGGTSDHLVSEALYLTDPEGNGIEIYCDRPRSDWKRADGKLQMSTLPLDLKGLLGELGGREVPPEASDQTRIGHVHLNVADLEQARTFYADILGFEVTVEEYPGALFFAAGDYHHHVGVNTWAGEGAPPPDPGSTGLHWFELVLPSEKELESVTGRLRDAGIEPRQEEGGLYVSDPSENGILLLAR